MYYRPAGGLNLVALEKEACFIHVCMYTYQPMPMYYIPDGGLNLVALEKEAHGGALAHLVVMHINLV